jgi:hypothetical protein
MAEYTKIFIPPLIKGPVTERLEAELKEKRLKFLQLRNDALALKEEINTISCNLQLARVSDDSVLPQCVAVHPSSFGEVRRRVVIVQAIPSGVVFVRGVGQEELVRYKFQDNVWVETSYKNMKYKNQSGYLEDVPSYITEAYHTRRVRVRKPMKSLAAIEEYLRGDRHEVHTM